jgi:hypothetical protein
MAAPQPSDSDDAAAGSKARLPWLRPFMIGLIALVTPAAIYWFLYAAHRIDTWDREAWQVLDGIADELQAQVDVRSEIAAPSNRDEEPTKHDAIGDGAFLEFGAGERSRFSLDQLVSLESRGDFDAIAILAGKDGSVLTQSSNAHLAAGVPVELWGANGERVKVEKLAFELDRTREGAPKLDGAHEAADTMASLLRLASHPHLEMGGVPYAAFLVPVRLARCVSGAAKSPETEQGTKEPDRCDYVIVGLVDASRLKGHALRLSPIALTWISVLIFSVLLVMPFLKIRYMGRRERLHAWDMWMLAGSAFLGTGVATLLVVQLDSYWQLVRTLDDDLVTRAENVRKDVESELDSAFQQLQESTPYLGSAYLNPNKTADARILAKRDFASYPRFNAVFLVDATTQQQTAKWIPATSTTPLVSLDDQPWFGRATALHDRKYFVDLAVAKRTTGLDLAVVAAPYSFTGEVAEVGSGLSDDRRPGLAALATRLASIEDAALPKPFEFLVVRPDDGIIAMRSSRAPNGRESLFAEAPDMKGLVAAASFEDRSSPPPEPADFRYRGRMQRVTAMPLWDPLPLPSGGREAAPVLVAFYDKQGTDEFAAHLVFNAVGWLFLIVAACFVAAALVRFSRPRALEVVWPAQERIALYGKGCAAFAATALAIVVAARWLPEHLVPYAVVGFPAASLVGVLLAGMRAKPLPVGSIGEKRRLYPCSYVAVVMSALLALVATPVAVTSCDSASGHRAAIDEQIRINRSLELQQRAKAIDQRYVVAAADGECGNIKSDRVCVSSANLDNIRSWNESHLRKADSSDLPEARVSTRETPESWCHGLLRFAEKHLPKTHFSLALDSCLPRVLRGPMLAASALATIDSGGAGPRSDAVSAGSRWVWFALFVAMGLTLLAWFVHRVATRILGLSLEGDGVVDGTNLIETALPQRSLLLRPCAAELDHVRDLIRARTRSHCLDLRDVEKPAALAELLKARNEAVLVTGLEWRLLDPEWRSAVVAALEPDRSEPLVLVSELDPLYFLSHCSSKSASSELERWSQVLEGFTKVRFPQLQHVFSRPPPEADPDFLEWVRNECRWDDRLVEIGESLLARTDLGCWEREHVVDYVLDEAEAHYRSLWSLCSIEERMVLVQLAREGLVNPKCFDVLRHLRRRRLIRVDPRFRLMNDSFHLFVLETEECGGLGAWEREGAAESSARVRGPLLALGFVAAAIMLFTQGREVADVLGAASATGSVVVAVATIALRARTWS